jgi:hypothetical protein
MLSRYDGKKLTLALLLIFLPLVDSLYPVIGLGLRWHSPMFMALFNNGFMLAKIVSIAIGLRIFSTASLHPLPLVKPGDATKMTQFVAIQQTIISSVIWLVSIVHVLILALVLLLSLTLGRDSDDIHYEQKIGGHIFYVHTIDPGAMGKAFHNVGLKCELPFGRYQIIHLGRIDYVGQFELDLIDEVLHLKNKQSGNLQLNKQIVFDAKTKCGAI